MMLTSCSSRSFVAPYAPEVLCVVAVGAWGAAAFGVSASLGWSGGRGTPGKAEACWGGRNTGLDNGCEDWQEGNKEGGSVRWPRR
jgi:hypothetical protein